MVYDMVYDKVYDMMYDSQCYGVLGLVVSSIVILLRKFVFFMLADGIIWNTY